MKQTQRFNLIASICLFLGSILNLLNHFLTLPSWLYFATIPLGLAAIVLYGIALSQYRKNK